MFGLEGLRFRVYIALYRAEAQLPLLPPERALPLASLFLLRCG